MSRSTFTMAQGNSLLNQAGYLMRTLLLILLNQVAELTAWRQMMFLMSSGDWVSSRNSTILMDSTFFLHRNLYLALVYKTNEKLS